jgi:threonine/homoserine/homoserine lactone efflux protein
MTLTQEFSMLFMGWIIGLLIAMPVGPVAVLSIKRTLHAGWPAGVATGLGAASADAIYAAIAAFGIYAVQEFLIHYQYSLRIIGGLILFVVGARMIWQKATVPATNAVEIDEPATENNFNRWQQMLRSFMTGLILTITNPLTLMAFLAVLANFGMSEEFSSYKIALFFVAGAFLGAASWWLSLVGAVVLVKTRLSETLITKINSVLAVLLVAAGVLAMVTGYLQKPLGALLH